MCRKTPVRNRGLGGCAHRDHHLLSWYLRSGGGWVVRCRGAYRRAADAAGGSAAVVATLAQGRMVVKVRMQPGGNLRCSSPHRSLGCHPTWAGALSIHLPGKDRRGNLGALPGVHTAGFHASRFALAYQNKMLQSAFASLFEIITQKEVIVNSICVNNADCNEIAIAKELCCEYNDCRLQ